MVSRARTYGEGTAALPGSGGRATAAARDDLSVLLVEDDDGDALLVEDLLEAALPGARLTRAHTFAQALATLKDDIDCLLLDLKLPDAEGLDTVVRLRAQAPGVPLIVLTGLNDEAAGVGAVEAGAQDYLVKGHVDGNQLARAIRYSISRRQADEARQQLRLAQAQSREVTRLERGLAPRPLIGDDSVWIATCYHSGRDRALLGGDFFDVAETPDGHVRLVVGDVCGHGPDEAAIGVCLRAAWRALAICGVEREQTMRALQRVLEHEREIPLLFTTLCTLEIETGGAGAEMVLAGHPPPILIDGSSVSDFPHIAVGPPIGLGDARWQPTHLDLPAGWAMLLHTDGITEGRIGQGSERLGTARLQTLIVDYIAAHDDWREQPDNMFANLIAQAEALNGGALTDDVAMVLLGSRDRSLAKA
ncbi:MAG TPA: SpoIIE family protein phosphatase [Solirubrobacteraceae bacterium]|jgi:serine phosphatase RsbU (regulator of sigma subunit)|nr:SpoIIE family protein phosphatase [Solirubrobacteraceae bacterium]